MFPYAPYLSPVSYLGTIRSHLQHARIINELGRSTTAEEKEAEAQGEKASTAEGGAYEIFKVRWATFKLRWCVAVHAVTDRPRFAQFS